MLCFAFAAKFRLCDVIWGYTVTEQYQCKKCASNEIIVVCTVCDGGWQVKVINGLCDRVDE